MPHVIRTKLILFLSLTFIVAVPYLVAEILLSFYYPVNNYVSTLYIAGLGVLLGAGSLIFLNRLDIRWKGKMFRMV